MNSTLCYWISCKEHANDVIDVVVYVDVGENKAIELGQENEIVIDDPPRVSRATWAYTRTTFMRQIEEDLHRSHHTTI